MPGDTRVFGDDFYPINSKLEKEADVDASINLPMNEKENSTRENNVAKIKVV
ncbi:kinesin motor catalytic domain protein, partial [Trifolium medium]|nr:kinesin motor catalytic domain protein [Trifolium medium]